MHHLTLVLAICLSFAVTIDSQKKIVCYFASWAYSRDSIGKYDISNIDPTLCTHLIYSFIGLNADASIKILDYQREVTNNGFRMFNELRQKSPSTKTIVSIGGWTEGSDQFTRVVSDSNLRARFVSNIVAFLKQYNFNGLDVDWEYPAQRGGKPSDKENFVILLRELKQTFGREGFSLSAAVNPTEYGAGQSYNIREISKSLDFINLMTYDYHGTFDEDKTVGHNAPLYAAPGENANQKTLNVNSSVNFWISQGAPIEKINVGTAFYGRSFTLADPNQHKRGSPFIAEGKAGPYTKNAGTLAYYEICTYTDRENWTVRYDPEQHVVYAFKADQIVGYDDVNSITEKAAYIKNLNLGGAMVWSIDQDDSNGVCNGGRVPLLRALNKVLRN
ncbi:acidic mammalian chitinase-like [Belonocnema kinseyi]|uniref:acidic mammalian chitinase-like n=1 Tax=Belonocnema kinseyi TaxID=2817044 RepID=UPI00143DF2B2|nr:acidic mammalian chitinase-like [Belonocnema kinseyi]XP_033215239.1 acidic mammalian chitinase-like [Belonocnema kinseyi]